jgi:YfiH family protein
MKIIKSRIFSAYTNLVHGISTREGGSPPFYNNLSRYVGDNESNVKQNRDKFFSSLGVEQSRLVHANQVHSGNVKAVSEPGLYKETDGLITFAKNLFLVVSVADCLPVMLYDSKKHIAANIHAGWRGTQKKIVRNAIDIMKNEFGSLSEDISAFLGPCISEQNFEVGEEVAELFEPEFVNKRNSSYYVDIIRDNIKQLNESGIKENQIEVCGLCTYNEREILHSYRRDKDKSGRMFAVIGINAKP